MSAYGRSGTLCVQSCNTNAKADPQRTGAEALALGSRGLSAEAGDAVLVVSRSLWRGCERLPAPAPALGWEGVVCVASARTLSGVIGRVVDLRVPFPCPW